MLLKYPGVGPYDFIWTSENNFTTEKLHGISQQCHGNVAVLEAVKHGFLLLVETQLQVELRPQIQV